MEITKARKKGPGSRGGKYWIDANGKVHYGPPPKGVRGHKSQTEVTKRINRMAKSQLSGIKTADDLASFDDGTWEIGVSGDETNEKGGYNHYGAGKAGHDAALEDAKEQAKSHPDITYAVIKVDGNYVLAAKSTSDLLKDAGKEDNSSPEEKQSAKDAKSKKKQGDKPDNLAAAARILDLMKRYYSAKEREKMPKSQFAGPSETFPIKTQQDVKNAAKLIGHAKDPEAVKRKIIAIAREHGWKLPKAWEEEENKK